MVRQVPGFSLDGGEDRRGFSGAVGNLLIDGVRPSSKSQGVEGMLQRIPASQVVRLEVLRGAAVAGDASGQAILLNVVLIAVARIGEVDVALIVKAEVIGCVEHLTIVVGCQDADRTVMLIAPDRTRAAIFAITAGDKPALRVKVHAIGAATWLFPNLGFACIGSVDVNPILRAVGEIDIARSIGGGTFGEVSALIKPLQTRIGWNRRGTSGHGAAPK